MELKKAMLGFSLLALSFSLAACGLNDTAEKSNSDLKQPVAKNSQPEAKKGLVDAVLERPVDGDTIKVSYNGNIDTVRYLLIDTPETKKPNSCVQPYGEDASKRNKELVSGSKLQLEFDKGERRDKFGRLLAYVYVDGKSVQETLLKEGLARVAYVYEPNTKYIDQFRKDEQEAQTKKRSIWSKNGYVNARGFKGCVKQHSTEKHK
jgi:micrococcal nuclease